MQGAFSLACFSGLGFLLYRRESVRSGLTVLDMHVYNNEKNDKNMYKNSWPIFFLFNRFLFLNDHERQRMSREKQWNRIWIFTNSVILGRSVVGR